MHALPHEALIVAGVDHVSHAQEEGVRVLLLLTSEVSHVLKDLIHGHNRDAQVDGKALGDFGLEGVGRPEEGHLGVRGPALDEASVLVQEALL